MEIRTQKLKLSDLKNWVTIQFRDRFKTFKVAIQKLDNNIK